MESVWPMGGLDQLQFMNQFYEMAKNGRAGAAGRKRSVTGSRHSK